MEGNVLVGLSGGPTPVINSTYAGIIHESFANRNRLGALFGAVNGFEGLLSEQLVNISDSMGSLNEVDEKSFLDYLSGLSGAYLGSCRKNPSEAELEQTIKAFEKYSIRTFFYIGGNDSAEALHKLAEYAEASNYEIQLIHVIKTIDNDLMHTHFCPGYPSAATFALKQTIGDSLDTAGSFGHVKLNVLMGRATGWITAATAAYNDFLPTNNIIVVPEAKLSLHDLLQAVSENYSRTSGLVVSVSEGYSTAEIEQFRQELSSLSESNGMSQQVKIYLKTVSKLSRDAFDNPSFNDSLLAEYLKARIESELGFSVRKQTMGYSPRSFPDQSQIDLEVAKAIGEYAVNVALAGESNVSVVITKDKASCKDRLFSFNTMPLESIAGKTRTLEAQYLDSGKVGVTSEFLNYIRPLIGINMNIIRALEHASPIK